MKLNLGCGQNKKEGYVNVDKYDSFAPDVVWDLEIFPWPFESNSVDEIVLYHVLEHLGATVDTFLGIMKELYRVCKPDAQIFITVPHSRSDGFLGDPTHVRPINSDILSLFSKKKNLEWKEFGWPNTPLATYIDVDFDTTEVIMVLRSPWREDFYSETKSEQEIQFAINSYFNVVDEIKITLVARK
jgi:SAM-dependent methyltransferase